MNYLKKNSLHSADNDAVSPTEYSAIPPVAPDDRKLNSIMHPNSIEAAIADKTSNARVSYYTKVAKTQNCPWCRGSGIIRAGLHCGPCGGKGWTGALS